MTIEEMRRRKKELGYTNAMIAEKTGVALATVQKIFSGVTAAPRYDTIQKLEKLLSEKVDHVNHNGQEYYASSSDKTEYKYDEGGADRGMVGELAIDYNAAVAGLNKADTKESAARLKSKRVNPEKEGRADDLNKITISHLITLDSSCDDMWPHQGEYTLEDYYSLPDDIRVELIDGVFYNLAAPSLTHQTIVLEIGVRLRECIKENDMPCRAFISPVDVRLDRDDKTMVQPDVIVICHEPESDKRLEGAPELVIEVLSDATRRKDCTIKLEKYMNAGISEYWIIDPYNQSVWVYDFENDN